MITYGDLDIAARTVWQEARGEPYEGMKAVAHVIINRMNFKVGDRWSTIAQVCLDWLQFSAWREADNNFTISQQITPNDRLYRICLRAFLEALEEADFTLGARHYVNLSIVTPTWVQGKTPCYKVGAHSFYNNIT